MHGVETVKGDGMREAGELLYKDLADQIIGAAMSVHAALGPGLLEAAYESCLAHEFMQRGLTFARQIELPVVYKGHLVDCGFRIDLLVENKVIVELKAVDKLLSIHTAQPMTYMKLSHHRVGLLLNFNVVSMRDGIIRRVL